MYTFPALISSSDWNLKEEIQRCFRISSEIPLMLEQKKKEEIVTIEKAKVGQRSGKKRKRRSGNWQNSMRQKGEKHEGI